MATYPADEATKKTLREDVRPMCERGAALAFNLAILMTTVGEFTGRMAGLQDADVIDDGRLEAEGITPPTVGKLRSVVGLMQTIYGLAYADGQPTQAMLDLMSMCVNLPRVS